MVQDAAHFHVLEHRPGESFTDWLRRQGPAAGTVDPRLVPYYVLLVGSPELIPFEFQYLLDVEYAVGRVCFDDDAAYGRYAESVVGYETAATPPHDRSVAFFGMRHVGDGATKLSTNVLVPPLAFGTPEQPAEPDKDGYRSAALVGDDATRAALLDVLGGRNADVGRPAMLFTATHGLGLAAGNPR